MSAHKITSIEDLDESRSRAKYTELLISYVGLSRAELVREHDAAHGLPADLVVSLMRLYAADPASVTAAEHIAQAIENRKDGERYGLKQLPPDKGRIEDEPDISCSFFCQMAEEDIRDYFTPRKKPEKAA
jgi:hypothetical protein